MEGQTKEQVRIAGDVFAPLAEEVALCAISRCRSTG
jgi:hypothetical protein